MSIPGFTAESSIYRTAGRYRRLGTDPAPFGPDRLAGSYRAACASCASTPAARAAWTDCTWLQFSCLELGNRNSCRRWRLECVAT